MLNTCIPTLTTPIHTFSFTNIVPGVKQETTVETDLDEITENEEIGNEQVRTPPIIKPKQSRFLAKLTKRFSTINYENAPNFLHKMIPRDQLQLYVADLRNKSDMAMDEFEVNNVTIDSFPILIQDFVLPFYK